jgi:hypothetical protein
MLHADLEHTGTNSEDSFYAGYLRWLAEVVLPAGSSRVSSDPAPAPDPAAPNGGSYQLELYPQQTKHLTIAFTMPGTKRLLICWQPGLTPAELTVTSPGCQTPFTATLTNDITLDLGSLCR